MCSRKELCHAWCRMSRNTIFHCHLKLWFAFITYLYTCAALYWSTLVTYKRKSLWSSWQSSIMGMFRKLSAWQIYLLTCRWSFYSDVIIVQYRKFTQFAALPQHFLVLPRIRISATEWMLTKSHCILGNDWQCLICCCKIAWFSYTV